MSFNGAGRWFLLLLTSCFPVSILYAKLSFILYRYKNGFTLLISLLTRKLSFSSQKLLLTITSNPAGNGYNIHPH